jgi:hypothetical protein
MAKGMKSLVPLSGTVVVRDGRRVRPVIGKAFDYSDSEIEQLKASGARFRTPTDETETAEPAEAARTTTTRPSKAEASQAGARRGKKKATAETADDEIDEDEDGVGDKKADTDDDL